jgi:TetR/AcrR family transcriptional repressor of uid operon
MRTVDPARHEEKRREILAAAGRCFGRSGFHAATISAICAEAKISPGHLYHYFASKEAIVSAMAELSLAYADERFREMATASDVLTALIDGLKRAKRPGAHTVGAMRLELLVEAGRNPAIASILRDHSRALRHQLAAFLRGGQDRGQIDRALNADVAAAVLLSVADGALTLQIRDPSQDIDQGTELLRTMIVRFLTPPVEVANPT